MSTDFVTMAHQFVCGLHGHDSLLHFERGRLSLKCLSCGHESPGWDIKQAEPPEAIAAADAPEPRRRFFPHVVGVRRAA